MSKAVMYLGKSKVGKSAAYCNIPKYNIKGLNPNETVLISTTGKDLEMKMWENIYNKEKKNYFIIQDAREICKYIELVSNKTKAKNLIIDDFQYSLLFPYIEGTKSKKGYDTFNKIIEDTADTLKNISNYRKDLIIYILSHVEEYNIGEFSTSYRFKALGKGTHEKITPEGLFSIVLYGETVEEGGIFKKVIRTEGRPNDTCGTPADMFDSSYIPNDLSIVEKNIREYYGI